MTRSLLRVGIVDAMGKRDANVVGHHSDCAVGRLVPDDLATSHESRALQVSLSEVAA
jgi:hypothetical protein